MLRLQTECSEVLGPGKSPQGLPAVLVVQYR